MPQLKIRGGYQRSEPYPLNQFTEKLIKLIGKRIVHQLAIGQSDVEGNSFTQIFANSISGTAVLSPLGLVDVVRNECAWSVKTLKIPEPHKLTLAVPKRSQIKGGLLTRPKPMRLISGRNSPNFSAGISDPLSDIKATGDAVLGIYNARVVEAMREYPDLRMLVFARNIVTREFSMYERAITQIDIGNYSWSVNSNGNFEACDGIRHAYTWQPHGSQFTIHDTMHPTATCFSVHVPPRLISMSSVLKQIGFKDSWVVIK